VSVSLLLDIFCRLGVSGLHTVRTLIKITCQKLLITMSYIYGCTYIWLHNILYMYTRRYHRYTAVRSCADTCQQMDGRTDTTKPIGTFRYLFKKHLNRFRISKSRSVYFLLNHNTPVGPSLLLIEASRPHSDTPQSVVLHWTSDHVDTETSSNTTYINAIGDIRTRNPNKLVTTEPPLKPRGHSDRLLHILRI
jgi:hypothetical protein